MAWRAFYKNKMYRVVGLDSKVHIDQPYEDVVSVGLEEVVLMERIEITGRVFYENDICVGVKCHTDKKFVIRRRHDEEFIGFIPVQINKKGLSAFVRWDDLRTIGNALDNPELLDGVDLKTL